MAERWREIRLRLPIEWYEAIREVAEKEGISTQSAIEALIAAGLEATKPQSTRHIVIAPGSEATQ